MCMIMVLIPNLALKEGIVNTYSVSEANNFFFISKFLEALNVTSDFVAWFHSKYKFPNSLLCRLLALYFYSPT